MSKNLALTLARAKNNGIREGIDAVCEAMALAHYNTAIELELDEREVGSFYTRMRKELLEISHRAAEIRLQMRCGTL